MASRTEADLLWNIPFKGLEVEVVKNFRKGEEATGGTI
jgi:hypothetical protein